MEKHYSFKLFFPPVRTLKFTFSDIQGHNLIPNAVWIYFASIFDS